MSTPKQQVTVRDLVEEAKKRIVVLGICVVGLSYLMSLTSPSVWVNLPAAASLIVILRYLSLDLEMRRKAASYNNKSSSAFTLSQKKTLEWPKLVDKSEWRNKVNSPVVEDAVDHLFRHLVSEWMTDLWYSRLTPDREGPEELVHILHGVFGEISARMRNVNLIHLLTRDLIHLICTHLELFRATQAKIEKRQLGLRTIEHRDLELRQVLAAENKLHPALFSAEAEHKVLQHITDGLISSTFKPEDLHCSFFHYVARELLACAAIRPVVNLANPRFINERIECLVINRANSNKAGTTVNETAQPKPDEPPKISSDHFSRFLDPTGTGVELVQLKSNHSRSPAVAPSANNVDGNLSKDPLLSVDARSTRSWSSLPMNSEAGDDGNIQRHHSSGEWGDMLDLISHRKRQALAPEHFENMWTKGRNYRKKEGQSRFVQHAPQESEKLVPENNLKTTSKLKQKEIVTKLNPSGISSIQYGCPKQFEEENVPYQVVRNIPSNRYEDEKRDIMHLEVESGSSTSYTSEDEENGNVRGLGSPGTKVWDGKSEDEENGNVTGLGSPGTKVWDGKSNRNTTISHIHHPLENSEGHMRKKTGKGEVHYQRVSKNHSGHKRSRPSNQAVHVWQEVERTSFLSGDGQDILNPLKEHENDGVSSDDSEAESLGRIYSGAAASSSASSFSLSETHGLNVNSLKNSLAVDSFYKLRCEVLGANIVKSGSKTFAVYSISVTDVNNNSWSIKRRYSHFEELHRRLKEFSEYNLHLPPKHFLSTGLDVPIIQERCKLLDDYLKKLMQLPTISGSIEVWDFLSVDSQTYYFSNSFSIVETLSVDLEDKPSEKSKRVLNYGGPMTGHVSSKRDHPSVESREPPLQMQNNVLTDGFKLNAKSVSNSPVGKDFKKSFDKSGRDSENRAQTEALYNRNLGDTVKGKKKDGLEEASKLVLDAANDPTIPTEWVPPNLSVPILDLVDVIFQLQDGGWIRRKAFWVAKQILQLGMGDAFDDWLIEKIQLLRKGSVVASGIKRVEQILWPDGIFLTKHPKRQSPPSTNPSPTSPNGQQHTGALSPRMINEQQDQEARRRAKFVYDLMIENAPAAIVSLVGHKEYEQCAKDLYYFLQSSVCLKQLAFDLLELLLLSAFPELDYVFKQFHEEKYKFGEFKAH